MPILYLILFSIWTMVIMQAQAQIVWDPVDGAALCDFYEGLTAGKSSLTNWQCSGSGPYSPCSSGTSTWYGVSCGTERGVSRVVELDVRSKGLAGSIPSTVGNLLSLTWLNLGINSLSGSLPSQLGQLTKMLYLSLYTNQFTGSLPSTLGNLRSIAWLQLQSNFFSGSLPSQLGLITNLQGLVLMSNQFTSAVPASFCDLSRSITLTLDSNPGLTCLPSCLTNPPYTMLQKDSTLTAVCGASPVPVPIPTSQSGNKWGYNYSVQSIYSTKNCSAKPVFLIYKKIVQPIANYLSSPCTNNEETGFANELVPGITTYAYETKDACLSGVDLFSIRVTTDACQEAKDDKSQYWFKMTCKGSSQSATLYSDRACSTVVKTALAAGYATPYKFPADCDDSKSEHHYTKTKCTYILPPERTVKTADAPRRSSIPVLAGAIGSAIVLVLLLLAVQHYGVFNNRFMGNIARKVMAISPLFAVTYNTIVSLYGLAAGVTTTNLGSFLPKDKYMGFYSVSSYSSLYYDDKVDLGSNYLSVKVKFWGQACASGLAPSKLSVSCSYANHSVFKYILYTWVVYFSVFSLYRFALLWSYDPLDLRFFIATQRLNCLMGNYFFLLVLLVLSVMTFVTTLYFSFALGAGVGPVIQAGVFLVVNILVAKKMTTTTYNVHEEVACCFGLIKNWSKLRPMSDFPFPCMITLPAEAASRFGGVHLSPEEIFQLLEKAISKSSVGDHTPLSELGNPKLIVNYMSVLTELDGKSKRRNEANADKIEMAPSGFLGRFASLSPLVALLLGFANLFQSAFDVAETYSPTEQFASAAILGFFSSPGPETTTIDSFQGRPVEVPAKAQYSQALLTICRPDYSNVKQGDSDTFLDKHVGAALTCPPQLAFYIIALTTIISIFFVSWVSYRLFLTWQYKVNDLRFLVATDRANNLRYNLLFCCTGAFFSSVGLLSLWYYRARANTSVADYLLDITSFALMILSIMSYSSGRYESSIRVAQPGTGLGVDMRDFPYECIFSLPPAEKKLSNLYGALVTHDRIFKIIELALTQSIRGEDSLLKLLCVRDPVSTPRIMRQYMAKLMANDESVDAKGYGPTFSRSSGSHDQAQRHLGSQIEGDSWVQANPLAQAGKLRLDPGYRNSHPYQNHNHSSRSTHGGVEMRQMSLDFVPRDSIPCAFYPHTDLYDAPYSEACVVSQLSDFYTVNNPSKISDLPILVEGWKQDNPGRPLSDMLTELEKIYAARRLKDDSEAHVIAQLHEFYAVNNPSKLQSLYMILDEWKRENPSRPLWDILEDVALAYRDRVARPNGSQWRHSNGSFASSVGGHTHRSSDDEGQHQQRISQQSRRTANEHLQNALFRESVSASQKHGGHGQGHGQHSSLHPARHSGYAHSTAPPQPYHHHQPSPQSQQARPR